MHVFAVSMVLRYKRNDECRWPWRPREQGEKKMLIEAKVDHPPAEPKDWDSRWEGPDKGLVVCWLRGLEKRREDPELAARATSGELPVLAWKGGVPKALKVKNKVGALLYLATWQGLRGEDLLIDTDREITLTCARFGVPVLFTGDTKRLLLAATAEDAGDE